MGAQYKINFDRPPRLKKLPEALIISPELRHLYIHTDTEDTNRNLDRLYITRPKRLDTSKRRHAILHVKNSVLPSAAITSTEEIANAFNKYFTNIGPNLANSIHDSNPRHTCSLEIG
jgi:hypothetical protein